MKKIISTLLLIFLSFVESASASGQVGIYVTPKVSLGIEHIKATHNGMDSHGPFSEGLGSYDKAIISGGIAIGYDFSKNMGLNMRTEVEYMYTSNAKGSRSYNFYNASGALDYNGKSKFDIGIQSIFFNMYYDFRNSTSFIPYVGGGIGFGIVGMKRSGDAFDYNLHEAYTGSVPRTSQTNFVWNIGVGCAYEISKRFSIDVGYRYANFGKCKTKTFGDTTEHTQINAKDININQIIFGTRFTF